MNFNRQFSVGSKVINEDSPVFIIAEAGVNHGGDMDIAFQLIDVAANAGADAVKFQTFKADQLILEAINKAPYQLKTTEASESQHDMLRRLEVTIDQNQQLKQRCKEKGIVFLTTPFEEKSLEEIDALDLDAYKIASTDLTNLPFLARVAKKGKPIFLSTGMSYLSEVELALKEIYPHNKDVVLLACTANYPIVDEEANLNTLITFKKNFDVVLGYSDHSVGVGAAPYSVPMGVKVVEKHFTLDKSQEGPDHRASLDPKELAELVVEIRKIERYLGKKEKIPTISETQTRASLQKCLVAKSKIEKGELFSLDNLAAKRTGGVGISPIYYREIVGKTASRSFQMNEIIEID